MKIKQRPYWGKDRGEQREEQITVGSTSEEPPATMCSVKVRGSPSSAKDLPPFGVAKEVGRRGAGLATEDLLDMVWFREAERAGP